MVSLILVSDLNASKSRKRRNTVQRYIILDTDQGVDDGFALLALLKAEKLYGNIKLLAITCLAGNTDLENVLRNTLRILHDTNRMDVTRIFVYQNNFLLFETMDLSPRFQSTQEHRFNLYHLSQLKVIME